MNDQPAMTIDEPVATGWLRSEFYGDADKGQAYLYAARKQLGALKTRYGVNARVAQGEPGGFYRDHRVLPDGTQIETLTNDGHDTVRITVPTTQSFGSSTSMGEGESTSFEGQGEATEFTPEDTDEAIENKEQPFYDEWAIDYSVWVRFQHNSDNNHTLKQWDFENGFTGKEVAITMPTGHSGYSHVIFEGWVWCVELYTTDYEDTIFRVNVETGETQTLHTHTSYSPEGSHSSAATVTPLGVLFAIGRVVASYILIGADGVVIYDVAANDPGDESSWLGDTFTSFVNDGTHAYLHYIDTSSSLRGMRIIEIATGSSTTLSLSSSSFDPIYDFRMGATGVYSAMANGKMYGVRYRAGDVPPYEPIELFLRSPSTNLNSQFLLDVSSYSPFDPDGFRDINSGAAALTDDGLVLACTPLTLTVIDPATDQIVTQYSVTEKLGYEHAPGNKSYPQVNGGVSIIPGGNIVLLFFTAKNSITHLVAVDLDSGQFTDYSSGLTDRSAGYLVQYTITPATSPDPERPPAPEEWEYLSQTSV